MQEWGGGRGGTGMGRGDKNLMSGVLFGRIIGNSASALKLIPVIHISTSKLRLFSTKQILDRKLCFNSRKQHTGAISLES